MTDKKWMTIEEGKEDYDRWMREVYDPQMKSLDRSMAFSIVILSICAMVWAFQ